MSLTNIVLIGAGGNLGKVLLEVFLAEPAFNTSVLTRSGSATRFPPGVDVKRVSGDEFTEDEVYAALKGCDAVVCAMAPRHAAQQLPVIDAAVRAGVKWFVPAEFGANKEALKAKAGAENPVHNAKDIVLQRLKAAESKGMSWTAIATGPFIDWCLETPILGFDLSSHSAEIYGDGDTRWTGTTIPTIALATARILKDPAQFSNRFIYVYSTVTSQNEVVDAFEAATQSKWERKAVTWEDELGKGRQLMQEGNALGALAGIKESFYRHGNGADYSRDVASSNAALGLPEESIQQIVDKVVRGRAGADSSAR